MKIFKTNILIIIYNIIILYIIINFLSFQIFQFSNLESVERPYCDV
jgi:hypothetical protein